MDKLAERVAALEAIVTGRAGMIERLDHLDACLDKVKMTVWQASGALAAFVLLAQWLLK